MRAGRTKRPSLDALKAFLLTAVAGACLVTVAHAQQAEGLRGGLSMEEAPAAPPGRASLIDVPAVADPAPADTQDIPETSRDVPPPPAPPAIAVPIDEQAEEPLPRSATAEATDETITGTVREPPVDSRENLPADPQSERVRAIEGLNRPAEDNPYDAIGMRWGSFILKPTLETGITSTTNADSSVDGSDAVLSETTLRLNATSDWSSHRASLDAFGTFRKTLSGQEVDEFEGGLDSLLEMELGKDYRARGTFSYSASPESAASPVVITGVEDEPINQTITGTVGLEKDAGKARFAITGVISRDTYGDADLIGGGVLSQKDRDATLYSLTLRAGYEISPALTPFVETEIGRNRYDEKFDSLGYQRSADLYALKGGLEFDLGEKTSGEIAVGWTTERFDDARLASLSTPTIEGDILWSPLRGTNVRLSGSTVLESTTTPGESGSVLYSTSMAIERQMRANLTASALLGLGYRNYAESDGYDVIWNAEASLTWWLNRYAGLVGRVGYEDVSSNLPDRDSDTASIFLGLKLQR